MTRHCSALMGVVCFLGLQGLAFAGGPTKTSVQDGPWSDTATWGGTIPTAAGFNEARILHVVGVTATGQDAADLKVGDSGTGTLNISSGDLTVFNTLVGNGGVGTVNLSGGTFTPGNFLSIGRAGSGIFNMTGGSLVATIVELPRDELSGSSGLFTLSGGAMTLSGTMTIGSVGLSEPGTLTIEGSDGSFRGTNNGQDGTVHFTDESTLVIRPDGPISIDLTRFDVGTVNIDTGATLELDPLYTPQVGDEWFIFISAALVGGTSGSGDFPNVVTPAGVTISQNVVGTRGVSGPVKLVVTVTAVPTPVAWVDFGWDQAEDGSESNPWNSLTEGLANISAGGIVNIKGDTGTSATIETPTINQDVTLVAPSGTVFIGLSKGRAAGDSSQSGFESRRIKD